MYYNNGNSTKSFEKTLEILREVFGGNNQDLIDSVLQFLREEAKEKMKERE
jgi:hypothetical protein